MRVKAELQKMTEDIREHKLSETKQNQTKPKRWELLVVTRALIKSVKALKCSVM